MSLSTEKRKQVENYIETHPDAGVMAVLAQTMVPPTEESAVRALLNDTETVETETDTEPATDGDRTADSDETPETTETPEPSGTDEQPDDSESATETPESERTPAADEELTAADLLVTDGDRAYLPDQTEVRRAVATATDYYHDNLTENHRDLLRLKWGISSETVEDLKIGFAPSDNELVTHLYNQAIMPLTIIRAGLASAPVVKHAYAIGDCPDDCHHDVPEAFEMVGRMRSRGDIEYEDVDLAAVVAYAGREDCLDLYAWWDNRLIFPYWTNGNVRYLIGRATGQTDDIVYGDGEVQKYLKQTCDKPWVDSNAISEPIYGVDTVEKDEPLIITEGVTDAIMAHQRGFACISPVTKQFKSEHHRPLQLQAQRASEVYLCLDNEDSVEGLKGALKTGESLAENGIDARIATLPKPADEEKVDLADFLQECDSDELGSVLNDAVPPQRLIHDSDAWEEKYVIVTDGQPTLTVADKENSDAVRVATPTPDNEPDDRIEAQLYAADADPSVKVTYSPAGKSGRGEKLSFKSVGDRSDLWLATAPDDSAVRLLEYESGTEREEYTPSEPASTQSDGSALFDLDIRDVTGMDHLDRGKNPIEHRGDSENYFIIIQEGGDYLAYDHKAEAGYYALTFLLCKDGQRSVDDPTGRLDDGDIFTAWRQAKRDNCIPSDDPAPYRALIHIVREHDLLPEDMIPDADAYGDGDRLSATVYNRALDIIEDEYNVGPGRSRSSGGQHLPTEEELGLDEDPEDEQDELAQFVKQAKLNARKAGDS